MKYIAIFLIVFVSLPGSQSLSAKDISFDPDKTVITKHSVRIKGKKVSYTAETGMLPVWDDMGKVTAGLFFTYYKRTDVDNSATRPLMFSFNGGPGSASVWMHMAYTGPKVLNIDSEGYPLQPYGYKDNPHSVLDVADIVFVNPVNTGYSRLVPNEEGKLPSKAEQQKRYFGVNADIKYLAEWLNTFVSRYERWRSPKYLIGESYGTVRVSGLAGELQSAQWMYLNGVILVSPTTIGIDRDGPVRMANRLPYFAAAAWHHKALAEELQTKPFLELLEEVEEYTLFSFKTTRSPSFRFRNGEFVMIGLPGEQRPVMRAYSIASANYEEHLEFLSIKVPDGKLTSRLQNIQPGDEIQMSRKPTGTLVVDDLKPGKRLYLIASGTGLAPFMSIIFDPDIYDKFEQVILFHGVRYISELAYHDFLKNELPNNEYLGDVIRDKLIYYPCVTREPFENKGRITDLLKYGILERNLGVDRISPDTDRFMLCGSPGLLRDMQNILDERGFVVSPRLGEQGDYVIERAFVES